MEITRHLIKINRPKLRAKAVEIANEIIQESGDEGIAIATGLKRARAYMKEHPEEADEKGSSDADN
jgi:uncharacterized protein YdaT